jgi:hypothetical protein
MQHQKNAKKKKEKYFLEKQEREKKEFCSLIIALVYGFSNFKLIRNIFIFFGKWYLVRMHFI